jgi:hypothetical protein
MRYLKIALVFGVLAAFPAIALAHKAPTKSQRAALNTAFNRYVHERVPAGCLRYWVSTASSGWADVAFSPHFPKSCTRYASNGEVIFHLVAGKWKFVTAGSSFVNSNGSCGVPHVPKAVVKDFKLCG